MRGSNATTASFPTMVRAASATIAATGPSLMTGGAADSSLNSLWPRIAVAMPSASSAIRRSRRVRSAGSRLRRVPWMTTSPATMLAAVPPCTLPRVVTIGAAAAGAFLRGLEHEPNHSGQLSAALRQRPRHLERDRHVHIMTAGVHYTPVGRAKRQLTRFLDGQTVDVRPDQHRSPGSGALHVGDNAGSGHGGFQPVRRQGIETLHEIARGFELFERQFRHGVQLATVGQQVLSRDGIDLRRGTTELKGHRIILAN